MDAAAANDDAPRLILVDDDAGLLDGLRLGFRRLEAPWKPELYTNAGAALDALEQNGDAIIVSDLCMPNLSGIDFCERVRTRQLAENGPSFYFILLSGRSETEQRIEGLDAGADDYLVKPFDLGELIARIRVGARMIKAERALKDTNARLRDLAATDPLTGIWNRRGGESILDAELARASRGLQSIALCMVDIDHFKQINDTYGHGAGDIVLRTVAERLQGACRRYDAVVRWGGEEFVVVLPSATAADSDTVARRLLCAIASEPVHLSDDGAISATASIGVTCCAADGALTAAELISAADEAMYAAKDRGRNCVQRAA